MSAVYSGKGAEVEGRKVEEPRAEQSQGQDKK